jgi:hypothetical protein
MPQEERANVMRALISAYDDRRRLYVWRFIAESPPVHPAVPGLHQRNRLLGSFGPSYKLSI